MSTFKLPDFDKVNWKSPKTILLILPVLTAYAFWESFSTLRVRVWNQSSIYASIFNGIAHEIMAIGLAGVGSIAAAANPSMPFFHELGPIWEGVIAAVLIWAYVSPLIWLLLLRPFYRSMSWCWRHFDFIDKHISGPLIRFPETVFRWIPGSKEYWASEETNWFQTLLGCLVAVAALGVSVELGLQTRVIAELCVQALSLHLPALVFSVGSWCLFAFVAGLSTRFLLATLKQGRAGLATSTAALATYAAKNWLFLISTQIGSPFWLTAAVTFMVAANLGFPVLDKLFSTGFWEKMWKKLTAFIDDFVSGKDTSFRHLYLRVLGIALALLAAGAACVAASKLGFDRLAISSISTFSLLAAYGWLGSAIDEPAGNPISAMIAALAIASFAAIEYAHAGYPLGVMTAYPGFIVICGASFIGIAILYSSAEKLSSLPGIRVVTNGLAKMLVQLHKGYTTHLVKPVLNFCEDIRYEGYGHLRTGQKYDATKAAKVTAFKILVLHLTNIAVAWSLASVTARCVGPMALSSHLSLIASHAVIASYGATALVAFLSIGFFGRAVSSATLEIPGSISAFIVALKVGAIVLPLSAYGLWIAVPAAYLSLVLWFTLGAPLVLIGLGFLTTWAAPTMNIALNYANDRIWSVVEKFWNVFSTLFDFFTALFRPLWKALASLTASLWRACRALWQGIFGGTK
jgi:hypothetical protein